MTRKTTIYAVITATTVLLSGCVSPGADTPGAVVQINDKSVTVRGQGDYSLANAGKGWKPTPAITAQASEICQGAKFVSGTPSEATDPVFGFSLIDYLFVCP